MTGMDVDKDDDDTLTMNKMIDDTGYDTDDELSSEWTVMSRFEYIPREQSNLS
jgi:hypothetical protein